MFLENITRWLVYRQTSQLSEDEDELPAGTPKVFQPASHVQGIHPAEAEEGATPRINPPSIEVPPERLGWAGFNGRCNKAADTCYAWWVGGSLGVSYANPSPTVTYALT